MKILLVLGFVSLSSLTLAQTVWYNGDANGNADVTLANNGLLTTVYEDFVWNSSESAKSITAMVIQDPFASQVNWEIRQGMDVGTANSGTLITSGTTTSYFTDLGIFAGNTFFHILKMTADIGSVALSNGGSDFLGISLVPTGPSYVAAMLTTSGLNGVGSPLNNHNAMLIQNGVLFGSGGLDLSMGISASPVPEPVSLVGVGIGTLALLMRRRKLA